jgi:hypothetical protein
MNLRDGFFFLFCSFLKFSNEEIEKGMCGIFVYGFFHLKMEVINKMTEKRRGSYEERREGRGKNKNEPAEIRTNQNRIGAKKKR